MDINFHMHQLQPIIDSFSGIKTEHNDYFEDFSRYKRFSNWRGHEYIRFSAVMLAETLVHLVLSHAGWR